MVKGFILAALITTSVTPAYAGLPWKNVNEVQVTGSQMGICGPDQMVTRLQAEKDGVIYLFLVAPESRRIVVAEMGPDERPRVLHMGRVDKDGNLVISKSRPFSEEGDAAGPCPLLYPREASK